MFVSPRHGHAPPLATAAAPGTVPLPFACVAFRCVPLRVTSPPARVVSPHLFPAHACLPMPSVTLSLLFILFACAGYVSTKQADTALQNMGVLVSPQDLDEVLRVSKAGKPYSRSGEVRVDTHAMLEAIHAFMPDMDPVGVPSATERLLRRPDPRGISAMVANTTIEQVPAGRRIMCAVPPLIVRCVIIFCGARAPRMHADAMLTPLPFSCCPHLPTAPSTNRRQHNRSTSVRHERAVCVRRR